jgi:hypothetical protein
MEDFIMSRPLQKVRIKFENPGTYKIIVQGILDESWSDRLAGMVITISDPENGAPTTILIGHLRDQTQFSGVLNSLYELHLPILLVEYLNEDNGVCEKWQYSDTSS